MTSAAIELQIVDQKSSVPSADYFNKWVEATLDAVDAERTELAIRIVDREEMMQLNREFREINAPTNVLSFSFEPINNVESDFLGDIAICAEVVTAEADEQGKQWLAHWAHIVIHGVLHLCGYDHEEANEAQEMEATEIKVLAGFGYSDPYTIDV